MGAAAASPDAHGSDATESMTNVSTSAPAAAAAAVAPVAGPAVVAVRRAGSVTTFDAINHFFLIGQMIVPGSIYWNMAIGLKEGDVEGDEEGVLTMTTLGENIAWLLKALHG